MRRMRRLLEPVSPEQCLRYATECERMAEEGQWLRHRDNLLCLAELWRELAHTAAPAGLLH